jgi:hypothetical protein
MRGILARLREAQIRERQYDRSGPIKLKWQGRAGLVAELFIDDALWAFVEWSEKRQQWCIEDSQGRCLTHAADLRGTVDSKQGAIELATAMSRDGRLPTPLEALQRWDAKRERRRQRPSEVRRRQEREERQERSRDISQAQWDAEWQERKQQPLYEALHEVFDFADPALWRSNSFASLRPRLIVWMRSVVAELAHKVDFAARPPSGWRCRGPVSDAEKAYRKRELEQAEAKLARAREILGWLED